MQNIITNLDIDWEEALARQTGDVLAYQIHQRVRAAGVFFQQTADSLLQTSSEYLREEARLTPTQVEFEQFQTQLGELKHDVERAQARLQQILDKAGKQSC
jgi:ubiquinone biosynthesis protein UbiJ